MTCNGSEVSLVDCPVFRPSSKILSIVVGAGIVVLAGAITVLVVGRMTVLVVGRITILVVGMVVI